MQRLEVSGAVRPIYGSLSVKRLKRHESVQWPQLAQESVKRMAVVYLLAPQKHTFLEQKSISTERLLSSPTAPIRRPVQFDIRGSGSKSSPNVTPHRLVSSWRRFEAP
jgi:hypothetical protein